MLLLAGLVTAASMLLGVRWAPRADTSTSRGRWGRLPQLRPVHAVAPLVGLAGLLVTGWLVVGVAVAGAVLLVPSVLRGTSTGEQIARLEALGAWTRRLADLLASGAASSLERALERSAVVAPAPIEAEVRALAARLGPLGTRAALLAFAREMADPVADEVVMSLVLQLRHGGRGLAAVLADLAVHVDGQVRMRREVEADRAKPRSNVRTLVLLTLGLSGGLILLDRPYLAPYGTVGGQLALAVVVGIFAAALLWLRAIVTQPAGHRLLDPADLDPGTRR